MASWVPFSGVLECCLDVEVWIVGLVIEKRRIGYGESSASIVQR